MSIFKIRLISCLLVLTGSNVCLAQTNQRHQEFIEGLEKQLPGRMAAKNVPGMAIAIFDKGKLIYKKGVGLADVKENDAVTTKTGFNIGSISKLFTAWGVMKLVETGKIDLDTPVEQYITRWRIPESDYDASKVTIRSLLSHTGGISVHGYPGFRPEQQLPSLKASLAGVNGDVRADEKVEIIVAPQTEFKYSGGGYTILQLMIEEVTGEPFAAYMEKTVFKPLKMNNTSFVISPRILRGSAKPYDEEGKEIYLERFTAQAAAGLHTTLEDFIKFVRANFEKNKVLKEQTLAIMQTPDQVAKGKYGLGYMMYRMGPVTLKGHAGSNDGWESGFMIDFNTNSAIIMLTNGSLGKDVAIATLRQWVEWKMKK